MKLDWASTSLANATDHPVSTLVVSAFLTDGEVQWWLPLALLGIGSLGVVFGAWRTAALIVAAHVLGTVISQGILGYRIATGDLPRAYLNIQDVGPSYIVAGALVAGIGYARWPGRLLCAAGFAALAPSLFVGLPHLELSAVGHASAIVVALVVGGCFAWPARPWRNASVRPNTWIPRCVRDPMADPVLNRTAKSTRSV